MEKYKEIIIFYTKYPRPGHSKTRLIPSLGPDGAAQLQMKMSTEMVLKLDRLQKNRRTEVVIHYDGGTNEMMQQWLGDAYQYCHQSDGDIGVRMACSIADQLDNFSKIVLIGSDCPGISEAILIEALDALENTDMVIGPSYDGGYYLIGVRGNLPTDHLHTLFQDIQWSTDSVFTQTIISIKQLSLSYHTLPQLHDIDTPDDLRHIGYHSNP